MNPVIMDVQITVKDQGKSFESNTWCPHLNWEEEIFRIEQQIWYYFRSVFNSTLLYYIYLFI